MNQSGMRLGFRAWFRAVSVAAPLVLLMVALSCGGGKAPPAQVSGLGGQGSAQTGGTPGLETDSPPTTTLDEALAELDALEVPEGVDEAVFSQLRAALREALLDTAWASRLGVTVPLREKEALTTTGVADSPRRASVSPAPTGETPIPLYLKGEKLVSAPPSGEANKVDDLALIDNGDGTYTLTWTYRNVGDYNQDGIVDVKDISPLAVHFKESATATNEWVDGNEDGVIDIKDVTSIVANLLQEVAGYSIEGTEPPIGIFERIQQAALDAAEEDGRKAFALSLPSTGHRYLRVVPYDTTGAFGDPSNVVTVPSSGRGDWWMFGRDTRHTHRSPFVGPQVPAVKWRVDIGGGSNPVVAVDGTVYVTGSGDLYAVSPGGQVEWTLDVNATSGATPALGSDGTVYVSTLDGYLKAVQADGKLRWSYEVSEYTYVDTSPVIGPDGTVYAGAYQQSYEPLELGLYFHAINPDGTRKWRFKGFGYRHLTAAISENGTILVGDLESVYALNPDGTLRWQYELPDEGSSHRYVYSGPALGDDGTIYFTRDGNLLCALRPNGTFLWQYQLGGSWTYSSPAIGADGTIYIGSGDKCLHAINPNGTLKWRYETGFEIWSSPAVDAEGTVYVGSSDGYLYAIHPDGTLKWRYEVGTGSFSVVRYGPVIAANGTIYVASGGYLCCIGEAIGAHRPVAKLSAKPISGKSPLAVNFDASASYDPDGSIVKYEWDWDGDGAYDKDSGSDATYAYAYYTQGLYRATVRVTDDSGLTDTESLTVNVDGVSGRGDWWMYGHDAQRTHRSPFVGPLTATLKWRYELHGYAGSRPGSSPAIAADGTVYIGSCDHHIYAVKPGGTLKWRYETGSSVRSSPAIGEDGTVYVGSDDGHFYALNPDGTLNWRHRMGYTVVSSPVISEDGTIYVGCSDYYVYAFNPDGTVKWRYKTDDWIFSSPAIGEDGAIYVGSHDYYMHAVNQDGSPKWRHLAGSCICGPAIGTDERGREKICFSTLDYILALFQSGTLDWRYEMRQDGIYGLIWRDSAMGEDGTVYFGTDYGESGFLCAVSPDGTLKWSYEDDSSDSGTGRALMGCPAIDADGTVYVGNFNSQVYAINSDGTLKWQYETCCEVDSSPAIAEDGTLYVSNDRYLYAFADE